MGHGLGRGGQPDARQPVEGHAFTIGAGHREGPDRLGTLPRAGRIADHNRKAPGAVEQFTRAPSANRRLDDLLHIGDMQPVAGDGVAVERDLELGGAGQHLHLSVGRPGDRADDRQHLRADALQHRRVGPEDLDGDVGLDT